MKKIFCYCCCYFGRGIVEQICWSEQRDTPEKIPKISTEHKLNLAEQAFKPNGYSCSKDQRTKCLKAKRNSRVING